MILSGEEDVDDFAKKMQKWSGRSGVSHMNPPPPGMEQETSWNLESTNEWSASNLSFDGHSKYDMINSNSEFKTPPPSNSRMAYDNILRQASFFNKIL